MVAHIFDDQTAMRAKYAKFYDVNHVKVKTIMYETRDGQSITDSPYAIFKFLMSQPGYEEYHHYWSIEADDEKIKNNIMEYKECKNVHFVIRNSKDYLKWLTQAEVVITNATFQSYYLKQVGQTYINTWHGTPLKHMGFDIPGNLSHSQNVLRNFLMTDYIISPNRHTTEIFKKSYKMDRIYTGHILESGYPRIDLTLNSTTSYVVEKLLRYGISVEERKKTLIYMPTWTGESIGAPQNDIQQIVEEINYLREFIGEEYNVLVKVHPFVYKFVCDNEELQDVLIPTYLDANEILSIADILITDYSSVFFDFLVTQKPIIFYSWNKEIYEEDRGTYIPIEELPGPTAENIKEVIKFLKHSKEVLSDYQERYSKMRLEIAKYDDGKATERYVSRILKKEEQDKMTEVILYKPLKKLLIYPGAMRNNGITSSLINLTNNIDYNKYDVTLFMQTTKNWNTDILNNLNKINPNVRFLFKPGKPLFTLIEAYQDMFLHNNPGGIMTRLVSPKKLYSRETKRLLSLVEYDVAIDFSGYSFYWGKYIVASESKKKIVFQHNDLWEDSQKEVNGERVHSKNLKGLFYLYKMFDDLISVSKATMKINRYKLRKYADSKQFKYSVNTINPTDILDAANDIKETSSNIKGWSLLKNKYLASIKTTHPIALFEKFEDVFLDTPYKKSFSLNDEIRVVAELAFNQQYFSKIIVDNIYRGWIPKKHLKRMPDKVISEVACDSIGRIIWPGNHVVWDMPYNISRDAQKITTASSLKGIYVHVKQEVITTRAKYYQIAHADQVIGWIDTRAIAIKASETQYWRRKYYYGKKKQVNRALHYKLNKNTLNYKKVNHYGILNMLESDNIWKKPYGLYDNELSDADKRVYNNTVVKVVQEATTKKATYGLCESSGETIGWIDIRKITLGVTPIQQNGVNYLVKPTGKVNTFSATHEKTKVSHSLVSNSLKDIDGKSISPIDSERINFITMGRLSPEKNHKELFLAFSIIYKTINKNIRLYVLGSGTLEQELRKMIKELNLEDCIILLGQKENPFVIMKQCDYFILPSLYEGQPMVLLEALTLGIPIIASDIPANRYVLKDGELGNLILGTSSEAIVAAVQNLIVNPIKAPIFDYERYNKQAIEEFYSFVQ